MNMRLFRTLGSGNDQHEIKKTGDPASESPTLTPLGPPEKSGEATPLSPPEKSGGSTTPRLSRKSRFARRRRR